MISTLLSVVLLVMFAVAAPAATGTITTTVTLAGPFRVSDRFPVTLRLSGFTNSAPIDAHQFKISCPQGLSTFVGPSNHGSSAPRPNPQCLGMAGQESAGDRDATVDPSISTPQGYYADVGFPVVESDTNASAGFPVSFFMRADNPS